MSTAQGIAVYCSARDGLEGHFIDAARELGRVLAEMGLPLVYGGGGCGLMGETARACLDAGGDVIGVIPRSMIEKERALHTVSEFIEVETMHERKAIMAARARAFLAMPGGVGTLDETFEAITWNQLAIHNKPVVFVDIKGFYAPLKRFLDHAGQLGFIPADTLDRISFEPDVPSALEAAGVHTAER